MLDVFPKYFFPAKFRQPPIFKLIDKTTSAINSVWRAAMYLELFTDALVIAEPDLLILLSQE
jgi:hypothetical protein